MTKPKQTGNGIQWDSLQEVLESGSDTIRKGQQQFFTPLDYARAFATALPAPRENAVDLQMGTGNLLLGSGARTLLGADIDKRMAHKPHNAAGLWTAFQADTTLLAPILHEADWQADLWTLNPPFSIRWDAKRLAFLKEGVSGEVHEQFAAASKSGQIASGLATYLLALHFSTLRAEGYIVLSDVTADDVLRGPAGRHVWLRLNIPGSIFENCNSVRTTVLYFAKDHDRDKAHIVNAAAVHVDAVRAALGSVDRWRHRGGICIENTHQVNTQTEQRWKICRDEYAVRHAGKTPEFNIWIDAHQVIHRHLTPFQNIAGRVPKKLVEKLFDLEGQTPMALVVQKNTREALLEAIGSDVWTVDPKLPPLVEKCIREYHASRAPFYPLSEVQRIGYVDENEKLLCHKNGLNGFEKGQRYALASQTVAIGRIKSRLNFEGNPEELLISGQDLLITLTDAHGHVHKFMQHPQLELSEEERAEGVINVTKIIDPATHDLQALVEYFDIPEVPDIASVRSEDYRANLAKLDALEEKFRSVGPKFKAFKGYQKDDMARGCLSDGWIDSWQQGMGKSFALFTCPFLWSAERVLIVAPDSLHLQLAETARDFFGIKVRSLMSQEEFHHDAVLQKAALDRLNAGWIGRPARPDGQPARLSESAGELASDPPDPEFWLTSYTALGMNGADEWEPELLRDGLLRFNGERLKRRSAIDGWQEEFGENIGQETNGITCLLKPTLARLVRDLFDCVEIDEGVRLKSSDSYQSHGVRSLRPRTRLVCTGTPIKNRLEDLFWLGHWASGGRELPTARWPYADSSEAKEHFANEHQLNERNLTRERIHEEMTGQRRRFEKRTAEICNIHRLWKLLGPVVIRRRKEDCGEDIVPKIIKPIRVTAGTAQQAVYKFHLENRPEFTADGKEMKPPARVAVQIGLLRQVALCPDSRNLKSYHSHDPRAASWTDFTTKSAAVLSTVAEILSRGENVIIASPFQHFNERLHRRLREAKVSSCLLDGTVSAARRGAIANEFKQFHHSVMVAGIKAMGEGHSFECCPNLILPSLEWAFDNNDQIIERVHRINSPKPVSIYPIVTANTIDERLADLYHEKGDSASLALDGRLFAERTEEVNLSQLLAEAIADFDPGMPTIDEQKVEAEWPALAGKLGYAEQQFREWHPPLAPIRTSRPGDQMTLDDLRAAIAALDETPAVAVERKASSVKREKPSPAPRSLAPRSTLFTPSVSDNIRALLDDINSIQFPK